MNIQPIHPPTTPEAILAFEAQVGAKLPDDYKAFLLKYNGGYIEPMMKYKRSKIMGCKPLSRDEHLSETENERIQALFGLDPKHSLSLQREYEIYGDELPEGFLSIGYDPFGILILISLRTSTKGRIY